MDLMASRRSGNVTLDNSGRVEYKEAFSLFDKKGTGAVPRELLGDLLRSLGQNPTQAEIIELVMKAPPQGVSYGLLIEC